MSMHHIITHSFNLDYTLSCGQVFRWERTHEGWVGIVNGKLIKVKQEGEKLIVHTTLSSEFVRDYFRLEDDINEIYAEINRDELMNSLIKKYYGLRLIHQDAWECLVSYVCSSNNTIRNITTSIRRMCELFGNKIEEGYYSFPTPEALSEAEVSELKKCKLGFRAPAIQNIASMIAEGEFDLYGIQQLSYEEGRKELMKIKGVGSKIADCVLLFAFGKLESFPVDTHIENIMQSYYGENFNTVKKSRKRDEIARFAREYFGRYCGYAQEYLYAGARGI